MSATIILGICGGIFIYLVIGVLIVNYALTEASGKNIESMERLPRWARAVVRIVCVILWFPIVAAGVFALFLKWLLR